MDTGEYETNALVINNISAVNFAFYEASAPNSPYFGPGIAELEAILRKDGLLSYFDAVRRGMWCFRLCRKGKPQGTQQEAQRPPRSIEGGGHTLKISEEGGFEPAALVRNRPYGPNAANTPGSASSSASSAFDPAFRSAQSATAPSFPCTTTEQDQKAPVPLDLRPNSTISCKDAYESLILAALTAVSSGLSADSDAIPLNSRTLLLSEARESEYGAVPAIIASIRVYLTTTGNLVVSLSHSFAENLVNMASYLANPLPPLGITVLAAPLGKFATCQPMAVTETNSTEGSLVQSPDTQVLKLKHERQGGSSRSNYSKVGYRHRISLALSGSRKRVSLQCIRGKVLEQNSDGKRSPANGAGPGISWPASMCFCKMFALLDIESEVEESPRARLDQSFDPLKSAKAWFLSAPLRDDALDKRKKERDSSISHEDPLADDQPQNGVASSPVAMRGSSQTGPPPAGMYPTPPGGTQTMVGVTPTMDGTMSSPENNIPASSMAEADDAPQEPEEPYGDGWEGPEVKRQRAGSSFESDNLFGELGPDMFGETDITEADFSFFDEQPGVADLSSFDMPVIPNVDDSMGIATNFGPGQKQENQLDSHGSRSAPPQPSPTFAKPELRHARSTRADESRISTISEANFLEATGTKRAASPFNPDTVYKRIRASINNHKAVQQNSLIYSSPHQGSIFDRVDFGPGLAMVNSKYEGQGRFDYSTDHSERKKPSVLNEPPRTEYLQRHGKGRKGLKRLPLVPGEFPARMHGNQETASNRPSPGYMDGAQSDADEMSLMSDQDDSSDDSDGPLSPVKTLSLRRRRMDDDQDSLAVSVKELEPADIASPFPPLELLRTSNSETDLSLTKYFADPEPPWIQYSLPDDQLIMAAQILTDQFSASTILAGAFCQTSLQSAGDRRRQLSQVSRNSMRKLQSILPPCLSLATELQFRPLIEVQDIPLLGQPTRLQPRPPGADQIRPSNLFQIPSPHFELRRYESKLSVLPSSVSFWESLGLSPSQGGKDVKAICIFPNREGLADGMLHFTDRLGSIYESLKLGSFSRFPAISGTENGLFTFDIQSDLVSFGRSSSFLGPSLQSCSSKVCKALSSAKVERTTFVIFFLYLPDVVGSVVECCAVFNEIFEGYKKILSSKNLPIVNDLALQLIPHEFVASAGSVAMPSPQDFCKLSLEVYDRCSTVGGAMPSPAIVLEQAPPRLIDFKLSTNPSASLLHENTCLHIAYAQSIDERWVTAAWTDNRGSQQMTASYCLGRKGKSIVTPLQEIAREIWATTQDLISSWKIHWRIIIAKCGAMDPQEVERWTSLAQTESRMPVNLTLVAVDTDPSLQLLPPAAKVPNSATNIFYTTPVSTPQGSIVSPEQSGNPSTPLRDGAGTSAPTPGGSGGGGGDSSSNANNAPHNAADADADAALTDLTDQTWGALLSHRLPPPNSTNTTSTSTGSTAAAARGATGAGAAGSQSQAQVQAAQAAQVQSQQQQQQLLPPAALASGYLVKRGGARPDDPPVLVEVNLVHSEGSPRAYEPLLREMLTYYRGLGTLARARGMVDVDTDARPWHVAAAEKAVRALYMLM
ncbi:mediator complex subunit 13 C-terminal-domain-containing protein [Xylariaceae sp. FL0804]|nr:mediator complex subunit 13 C-terminal-domain-containing protein [Xylariaceae sp. FL0804]